MTLTTAPPTKQKRRLYALPIQVTLPASALTFLPEGDVGKAAAELYIGVIDDRGRMSDIARQEAVFTLPADSAPDTPVSYTATLQTRKGNFRVVVNVRDAATGEMGTARADVRVE